MDGSRGTECSDEEEPNHQGSSGGFRVRGGLITPLGGTRRGMDPQEPGIGRWWRFLGTQIDEHFRALEGNL